MKVPNGEEFPRPEYADALRDFMEKQANKAAVPADYNNPLPTERNAPFNRVGRFSFLPGRDLLNDL